MHKLMKSNPVDSSTDRNKVGSGEYNKNHPLCPKPQRFPPAKPEFLKPFRCSKHSQPNTDEGSGVLNMITRKNSEGKESACIGCLRNSGSPPRRTENPMVHDVKFLHQMELVSPLILSDQFGFSSASLM